MSVKVLVLSDLHFETGGKPVEIYAEQASLIALAGDIDNGSKGLEWAERLAASYRVPVVYVAGNHEFWGHRLKLAKELSSLAHQARQRDIPLYFLEQDCTVIETKDGPVRVLGATLWSDFTLYGEQSKDDFMGQAARKMPDYRFIRTGPFPWQRLKPKQTLDICEDTIKWMWEVVVHPFAGPTVIVTHTGPSFKSIHENFSTHVLSPVFASDFEEVITFGHVALWVHGHVHHSVDYKVGNTRVVANPRGYDRPGHVNSAFDPRCLVTL